MPGVPKLGLTYTRQQINEMLGGGVQSFLPMKNARVMCGCFQLETNSARTAVLQLTPFPVFLREGANDWKFIGKYRATRYLHREHRFLEGDPRLADEKLAGILSMEKYEEVV
jgi:hypothetical protein